MIIFLYFIILNVSFYINIHVDSRSIYKPNIDAKNATVCLIIFVVPGVYYNTNNYK